jgi:peptidoglycan/LPS O-acetylase OafA/YrhL
MTDQRIAGLDGIRAIAVLLVFASHTNNVANKLQFGTMGVWAFFVLSGFLIVRILHQERLAIEFHRTKFVAAIGNFFKRRTVRIFPIYYLVLGLAALLTLSGPVLNYSGAPWPFYWAYIISPTSIFRYSVLIPAASHISGASQSRNSFTWFQPMEINARQIATPYRAGTSKNSGAAYSEDYF